MTNHYLQRRAGRLSSVLSMLLLGVLVQAQPDLAIQISADHNPVSIYTNVTYNIQIENIGTNVASSVSSDITIPSGLAFVGQSVSAGTYDSWAGIWQLNNLAPGQIETVEITLFLLTSDPLSFPVAIDQVVPADPILGNNTASVTINGPTGGPPMADLSIVSMQNASTMAPGSTQPINFQIKNNGNGNSNACLLQYYLSTDNVRDAGDLLLGEKTVQGLQPSQQIGISDNFTIPASTNTGNYFILAEVDALQTETESDETNNTFNNSVIIQNTPPPSNGVDLELDLQASNLFPPIYNNVTLSLTLSNNGDQHATNVQVMLPFPTQMAFSGQSVPAGTTYNFWDGIWYIPAIAAGQSMTLDLTLFTLNTSAVTIYCQETSCQETDTDSTPNNNPGPVPVEDDETVVTLNQGTTGGQLPDCIVGIVSVEPMIAPGEMITFDIKARNVGAGDAGANHLSYWLSNDNVYSQDDVLLGTESFSGIPAMTFIPINKSVMIPTNIVPGNYYMIFKADVQNEVTETNEGNNYNHKPVVVVPNTPGGNNMIDLELGVSSPTTIFHLYEYVNINFTLENKGEHDATSITVDLPFPAGVAFAGKSESLGEYNQYLNRWTIPTLAAGQLATMQLTVFTLQATPIEIFAEVTLVSQPDIDSQPANGMAPIPVEDDETYIQILPAQFVLPPSVEGRSINGKPLQIHLDFSLLDFYPVPAENEVEMTYFTNKERLDYIMTDALGRVLQTGVLEQGIGLQGRKFDLSKVPPGTFYILIQTSGKPVSVKGLKVRP